LPDTTQSEQRKQREQYEQREQREQREQYEQREQSEQREHPEQREQPEQSKQSEQYEQREQYEQSEQSWQLWQFVNVPNEASAFSHDPRYATVAVLPFSSVTTVLFSSHVSFIICLLCCVPMRQGTGCRYCHISSLLIITFYA